MPIADATPIRQNRFVDAGEIGIGAGLAVWGLTFYIGTKWYVQDDERLRRMAPSRWWLDRRSANKRGLTQDEWFDRWALGQRQLVRWVVTPFLAVWLLLCVAEVARGL